MAYTLGELAQHVNGTVQGDATCLIHRVAPLDNAADGELAFLSSSRYKHHLQHTTASAVILSPDMADACPVAALLVDNPHLAYARIAALLNPLDKPGPGIHSAAIIDDTAHIAASASVAAHCVIGANCHIGEHVVVGPACVLGDGVEIGDNGRLVANVTLCNRVRIGRNAIIHPGVVIGADGFGLANDNGVWVKVPQLGTVVIGDDVEIGANTTIDRGALSDTIIGNGVKLDNQIQVAHNVSIGENTAIAGCVGIAGSARIGARCTIGGSAGVLGHLEIVDDVHITAMSLVTRSIDKPGVYSSGTPLQENRDWHRNYVRYRQLDDMARRLKALEKQLQDTTGKN